VEQAKIRKWFKLRLPWQSSRRWAKAQAELARTYRENRELDTAERLLLEALATRPGDLDLLTQAAEIANARKDWASAAGRWKQLLRSHGPKVPAVAFTRAAYAFRKHGDLNQAEIIIQRALQMRRVSPSLLRESARLAMARKAWSEAARRWQQVLATELGRVSSEPYVGLIRALRNCGSVEEADIAVREARDQFPRDVRILAEHAVLENFVKLPRVPSAARSASIRPQVEIVICVYNAFAETRACLEALSAQTCDGQLITLVDDASRSDVRSFLKAFVAQAPARRLIVNETNQGYTMSANRGLEAARADWVLLLNSDAIVTEGWLYGLLDCAASDSTIRAVGPLSNAATFQSLPCSSGCFEEGQRPRPETLERIAARVREKSCAAFPKVPMLNGFCLMLHKPTLNEVGYLDEVNFPRGYGEENDLCLRLLVAGHKLAIADNVYVYHARSASFGSDARRELSANAVQTLKRLWPGYSYNYISEIVQEIPALQQLRDTY